MNFADVPEGAKFYWGSSLVNSEPPYWLTKQIRKSKSPYAVNGQTNYLDTCEPPCEMFCQSETQVFMEDNSSVIE